jgi:hypothetical protein
MENTIMGYISDKLKEQATEDKLPPWIICPYCQSQVRRTRDDDFCSLLYRKRWMAEKAALDRLNTEFKTADEVVAAMDAELRRGRLRKRC